MKVKVLLTNSFSPDSAGFDLADHITLVIDVLRATSTITTAFGRGAREVIVSSSAEEAFKLKSMNPGYILCGEEKGIKIEGFDYDNSPSRLASLDLGGKTLVLKTSNGTLSFIKAKDSKAVYGLSFLNFDFTLDRIIENISKTGSGILLLCSGTLGKVSYDDAFVAGLAIKYLLGKNIKLELDDCAKLVYNASLCEPDIQGALMRSLHARHMIEIGLEKDIEFCSTLNKYNVSYKLVVSNEHGESGPVLMLKNTSSPG